jgi:hypothetical protein
MRPPSTVPIAPAATVTILKKVRAAQDLLAVLRDGLRDLRVLDGELRARIEQPRTHQLIGACDGIDESDGRERLPEPLGQKRRRPVRERADRGGVRAVAEHRAAVQRDPVQRGDRAAQLRLRGLSLRSGSSISRQTAASAMLGPPPTKNASRQPHTLADNRRAGSPSPSRAAREEEDRERLPFFLGGVMSSMIVGASVA